LTVAIGTWGSQGFFGMDIILKENNSNNDVNDKPKQRQTNIGKTETDHTFIRYLYLI
jgi:hypothetical protein